MKFATAYMGHPKRQWATLNTEESMTNQSDANETNINLIVAKYLKTGMIPQVSKLQPLYGDFTQIGSYTDALETIRAAQDAFMEVPAKIREQFGNDPARFIEYVHDPKNIDQLRAWGLANPKIDTPAETGNTPTVATPANGGT